MGVHCSERLWINASPWETAGSETVAGQPNAPVSLRLSLRSRA